MKHTTFKTESALQAALVRHIEKVHKAEVYGNYFAGAKIQGKDKMRIISAAKAQGWKKSQADLAILKKSHCERYGFLALELKKEPGTVFLKRGGFTTQEHPTEQAKHLEKLNKDGGLAVFAEGWDHALNIASFFFTGEPKPIFERIEVERKKPCRYTGAPNVEFFNVYKLVF